MKTWEMIKELTEHPEKKFRHINASLYCCNVVAMDDDGNIDWLDPSGPFTKSYFSIRNTLNWEWREVLDPVDFATAYKDFMDNGNTYYWYPRGIDAGWYGALMQCEGEKAMKIDEMTKIVELNGEKTWHRKRG